MGESSNIDITFSPINPFPNTITLKRLSIGLHQTDEKQLYFKRIYAHAIISMFDDDCAIGTCKCSNCMQSIDIFSKFCPECGAKIKGRIYSDKESNNGKEESANTIGVREEDA